VRRPGHLTITLRPGYERIHVPAHLDCLSGAGRPAARIDITVVDRAVQRYGDAGRYKLVFHARRALGRHGEHHTGFADDEQTLGLSRTYQLRLAKPEGGHDVVQALRDLECVENAAEQQLSAAPLDAAPARRPVSRDELLLPYHQINALEALREEPGLDDITVAVVDTGVVVGHPEFQRRCLAGYDVVDLGLGRLNATTVLVGDSRGRDYNPYDEVGHGCLVAGIIGARGWRVPHGLAGAALLLPIRVLAAARSAGGRKATGVGALPDIDAGLKIAIDLGATVINMSLGSPADSSDPDAPLPHKTVALYAVERGCILVAAAGNSGMQQDFYPAALPEVIAVGAVDAQGRRARFSTWCSNLALCAPGEGIVGVGRHGYQVSSGTSFASPFVAGVAALLAARARRRGHTLDAATAKAVLLESAQRLPGGPSPEIGRGRVDALAALQALDRRLETNGQRRAHA
jgi:subtilisin family serine protease